MDDSSPAKTLDGSEGKVAAGVPDANPTDLGLGLGLQSRVHNDGGATVSGLGGCRDDEAENAGNGAVIVDKLEVSLDEIRVSVEEVMEENVTVGSGGEELAKRRVEESEVKEIRVEILLGKNGSGGRVGGVGLSVDENDVAAGADGADGCRNLSAGEGNKGEASKDGTVGKDEEEEEEEEEEEGGESGDQDVQFAVGDFVWGKIKSHPWWPGQIYDPLEASDYAGRFRRRDRLLVAYFGDGTFAWCYPSQLKPFGKDFARLYNQSSSRSFINAVEKALDEFGRCVESQMTCSCVEARPKLVKPFTMNSGIKEGVTVPEGWIAEHSITRFQPVDFLCGLKDVAQAVSVSNTLELTVLKSRLSAFYHARGYGDLPVFYDPQGITDPEEIGDIHLSERTELEGRTDGPSKVDGGESLTSGVTNQKGNGSSLKGPDIAEDKLLQRKKQRSMSELMAGGTDSDVENGSHGGAEGGKEQGKSASASKKRKKSEQSSPVQEGKDEMKHASKSGKHKKADSYASLSVSVEEDKPCDDENQDDGADEGNLLSSPRKRKKSKYLSPPYTMLSSKTSNSLKEGEGEREVEATPKLLKISEIGEGMKKAAAKLTGAPPIIKCSGETFQKKASKKVDAEEKTPRSSSPRTPKLKEKKLVIDEYNVAPQDMLSDLSSTAVNPLFLGEDESSDSIKAFFEKFRNSLYVRGSDYNTYKGGKKRKLSTIKDADGTEKSEGKSGPKESGGRKSSKGSGGGGADHRGREGSSGRKKISSFTEPKNTMPPGNEHSEGTKETEGKAVHKKRKLGEEENSDGSRKRTGERASEKVCTLDSANVYSHTEANHKEVNGGGPAAILLTFGQGTTFPSNEDLITIFDKFGELNKSETEVLEDLGCARVVFTRSSDAEKAFNSLDKISALRTVVVSYRLRYISAPSRASEVENNVAQNQAKASTSDDDKDGAPVGFGSLVPGSGIGNDPTPTSSPATLLVIKKNLETMMSTLTDSGDGDMGSEEKLSPEVSANLIGEISGLLKKVTKLVDSSSQA
ncbi:PWWP domain-containing protein 3-like [Aristolochia californica]|uniref:PWWP domain-containing protein 3-like n=1 Tax=Aristolochia californica TaxID=171875 RepID=UPI0035E31702